MCTFNQKEKEEELLKCPYCDNDDSIFEREESMQMYKSAYFATGMTEPISEIIQVKYFCGRCCKDF